MLLSCEDDRDAHPYWYAQIIGVLPALVNVKGLPSHPTAEPGVREMKFLWVRISGTNQVGNRSVCTDHGSESATENIAAVCAPQMACRMRRCSPHVAAGVTVGPPAAHAPRSPLARRRRAHTSSESLPLTFVVIIWVLELVKGNRQGGRCPTPLPTLPRPCPGSIRYAGVGSLAAAVELISGARWRSGLLSSLAQVKLSGEEDESRG